MKDLLKIGSKLEKAGKLSPVEPTKESVNPPPFTSNIKEPLYSDIPSDGQSTEDIIEETEREIEKNILKGTSKEGHTFTLDGGNWGDAKLGENSNGDIIIQITIPKEQCLEIGTFLIKHS